jgi:NAD(P) transhydrogenase subunit beta
MSANIAALLYLIAGVLFVLALRGLSSPATSRQGNMFGMAGMAIAIVTTLALRPPTSVSAWFLVLLGMGIGGGAGAVIARRVPMTAMPQLVAAFHSAWPRCWSPRARFTRQPPSGLGRSGKFQAPA